ncbi:hypothetical protein CsSME_00031060 [Camellia sinensis var. sinensis]
MEGVLDEDKFQKDQTLTFHLVMVLHLQTFIEAILQDIKAEDNSITTLVIVMVVDSTIKPIVAIEEEGQITIVIVLLAVRFVEN